VAPILGMGDLSQWHPIIAPSGPGLLCRTSCGVGLGLRVGHHLFDLTCFVGRVAAFGEVDQHEDVAEWV